MPNRTFSFYFRNDGGLSRVLGVEPLDSGYIYHTKPCKVFFTECEKPGNKDYFGNEDPIKDNWLWNYNKP